MQYKATRVFCGDLEQGLQIWAWISVLIAIFCIVVLNVFYFEFVFYIMHTKNIEFEVYCFLLIVFIGGIVTASLVIIGIKQV